MRAVRGCPRAPAARSDAFAEQWAEQRRAQAELEPRLRASGATEPAAPAPAGASAAGVEEVLGRVVVVEALLNTVMASLVSIRMSGERAAGSVLIW